MSGDLARKYMAKNYPGVTPGDAQWAKGTQEFADGGKKTKPVTIVSKNVPKTNPMDKYNDVLSAAESGTYDPKKNLKSGFGTMLSSLGKK